MGGPGRPAGKSAGYVRYDFRTATRLRTPAERIHERYNGRVAAIGRKADKYPQLRDALDALPGWGPVTVGIFLRELRGVRAVGHPRRWTSAPPAPPAVSACSPGRTSLLQKSSGLARAAGLDVRDLESGLVRLDLVHAAGMADCPGGIRCTALGPMAPVRTVAGRLADSPIERGGASRVATRDRRD